MKRKTSTTPTKIWSFGALDPTDGSKLLLDQLYYANRYYNTLIEIERRRRERFRQARSEAVPALSALEAEWNKIDAELTIALAALPKPASGKKKSALTPEIVALKEKRREISPRMKELRAAFAGDEEAKRRIAGIDEQAQLEIKAARAATDLYWGSYLLIEKQVEAARKSQLDPRFRRFEGHGRVGVQLQGGLSLAELTSGQDTRLRLVPRTSVAKVKKPKAQHEVQIRVGSEGRAPIWATLPVVIHRPIPEDAKIQWAWIKVQNIAGRRKYFLQIVMESETFTTRSAPGAGTVAINFGWRAHEDGSRRVAYAVDDAGHEEEFCIPAKIESTLSFANNLRSARDLHFEDAKRALGAFMVLHKVPEWMTEETKFLWQWRSPKKLARVAARLTEELLKDSDDVTRWRDERLSANPKKDLFAPFQEIFAWLGRNDLRALAVYLELWRLKNRHLWQWEANARLKTTAHRNELFRVWARRLADRYSTVLIEEFDMRKMAQKPSPEEEQRPTEFRVSRSAAAPGEFRSRLAEVAAGKITKAPAHHNTTMCFVCKHPNERSMLHRITCSGCGAEWDQDANNCRNQLREHLSGEPTTGGARKLMQPAVNASEAGAAADDHEAPKSVVAAE